jgi:hypothetical protein
VKGVRPDRLRLAELTSGVGALVLGLGIGALLSERLSGLALPFLIAGAAAHAWGMLDKHRLERQSGASDSWWSPAAYWLCWMLLGLLAVGIAGRLTSVL